MISSLLHLVGLRPRVYYTLTNFRGGGGGGQGPLGPPPQYANGWVHNSNNSSSNVVPTAALKSLIIAILVE